MSLGRPSLVSRLHDLNYTLGLAPRDILMMTDDMGRSVYLAASAADLLVLD